MFSITFITYCIVYCMASNILEDNDLTAYTIYTNPMVEIEVTPQIVVSAPSVEYKGCEIQIALCHITVLKPASYINLVVPDSLKQYARVDRNESVYDNKNITTLTLYVENANFWYYKEIVCTVTQNNTVFKQEIVLTNIKFQPQNIIINIIETPQLQLQCSAYSNPPAMYTWSHPSSISQYSDKIIVKHYNNDVYKCIAHNSLGFVTGHVHIRYIWTYNVILIICLVVQTLGVCVYLLFKLKTRIILCYVNLVMPVNNSI